MTLKRTPHLVRFSAPTYLLFLLEITEALTTTYHHAGSITRTLSMISDPLFILGILSFTLRKSKEITQKPCPNYTKHTHTQKKSPPTKMQVHIPRTIQCMQDRELRLSRKRNFATKVEISSKFRRNFVEINNRPWIRSPDDTQIPSRGVSQFGKISGISKNVEKIELFFAMSRESAFASKWVGDHRPRSTAS